MAITTQEERDQGIGGSEAASVLGVSPWKSRRQLWREKAGYETADGGPDPERLLIGNHTEVAIISLFKEKTGLEVEDTGDETFTHPDHEFIRGHTDGRIHSEEAILECKHLSSWSANDWRDDQIPEYYKWQGVHYAAVLGASVVYYACLVGNEEFFVRKMEVTDEMKDELIDACVEFWESVELGIEPETDFTSDKALDEIKAAYTEDTGNLVELGQEFQDLHAEKAEIAAKINALNKEKKIIDAKIRDQIGENSGCTFPDGSGYTRTWTEPKEIKPGQKAGFFTVRFKKKMMTDGE